MANESPLIAQIQSLQRAIAQNPQDFQAHYHLAHALAAAGRFEEAFAEFEKTLSLNPGYAEAANDLGVLLASHKQWDRAVAALRRAAAANPDYLEAWNNLGNALKETGQLKESAEAYRRTTQLRPDTPQLLEQFAMALSANWEMDEAIATWRKVVAMQPQSVDALVNLGTALHRDGKVDEAIQIYRQGVALKPDLPLAHLNLSLLQLLLGDFKNGWEEHEWRWKVLKTFIPDPPFSQMMWDGSDLQGRRILLHPEGGYGDTIQFVRYAPLVAARGGQVVVGCVPELFRLLQTVEGISELDLAGPALPVFQVHCPMLSLPRVLKTTAETIPAKIPYIFADAHLSERCRKMMPRADGRLKVGLVWSGRAEYDNDFNRSLLLKKYLPLSKIPRVMFFSLQKGPSSKQVEELKSQWPVIDWTSELTDFADTAALIDNLDLVVTVDTAMAHLAGAMGKRVWILLPHMPDWRWLLGRDDTPWYPTMRLFRQDRAGDWETPIGRVAKALGELAGS
jgi:Flp pilus assembly protein TadD